MNSTSNTSNTSVAKRAMQTAETLAKAVAKVNDLNDNLADAKSQRSSLDARLNGGDATVTAADLLAADAEITRAAALVGAAQREAALAERLLVNADDQLALAVAPSLLDLLPVPVPVEVFTEDQELPPTTTPSLRVIQAKPAVCDTADGTIEGKVEVYFYRSALTVRADKRRLEKVLDDAGARVNVHDQGTDTSEPVHIDRFSVEIRVAHAPVPVIDQPGLDWRVSAFGQSLAGQASEWFQRPYALASRVGVRTRGSGDSSQVTRTVSTEVQDVKVQSRNTGEDGLTRITIEATIGAWPSRDFQGGLDDLGRGMANFIDSQTGTCSGGLGRIESANVTEVLPLGRTDFYGRTVRSTFVFVSRAEATSAVETAS